MIDRREFLRASGAAATIATFGPHVQAGLQEPQKPDEQRATPLRTITYNVLACRGYPQRAENEVYLRRARRRMAERFALELELYEPDLVTFQESPSEKTVARIAVGLGMRHAYFPGGFPGTVLTRHQIVASENCPLVEGSRPKDLFTRHWGKAVVRIGDEDVVVYTAHLHPSKPEIRAREVTEMLKAMAADLEAGRSMILQGDLNHTPDGPEYARWVAAGLVDTFARAGTGQPLTIRSTEPRSRIDYVWVHGPLAARLKECRVLFEGPFRTNPEDARSFALSDHIPVLATFRS